MSFTQISSEVSHPSLANVTELQGFCPPPFLDAHKFTSGGGHITGRLYWIYPQSFVTWYRIGEGISAVGLVICVFLLLSWAVLPASKTRRHYLSICLVIGIIMEAFAFVIPLGVRPPQCYDQITPNDMYTNLTCAFSGAFIIGGSLVVTVWTFVRSISMHLQICWDIVPGQMFFYVSQGVGWGIAGILFVVTMTITGVSYRFGDTCHVNANNSMGSFWGPLLGIGIAAALISILTFFYCIKVYLRNVWSDQRTETNGSGNLPSYHSSSVRTASARAVYQRVKKVVWLQWRSITIVLFLLIDIIFFAIVWVQMDNTIEAARSGNMEQLEPFLLCLMANGENREKCFQTGQKALVNQSTALAILLLLSLTGVQTGLMMSRRSMFTGWYEFFKSKFGSKREFVSLDAKTYQPERPQFELVKVGSPTLVDRQGADSIHEAYESKPQSPVLDGHTSPSGRDRSYRKPTMSFSGPRSPMATVQPDARWQGDDDYGRGGLGSHPPTRPPQMGELGLYGHKNG